MSEAGQIAKFLAEGGPWLFIVLFGLAVWRRKLYMAREYEAMREDRDFWRDAATSALNIGEAAVGRDKR